MSHTYCSTRITPKILSSAKRYRIFAPLYDLCSRPPFAPPIPPASSIDQPLPGLVSSPFPRGPTQRSYSKTNPQLAARQARARGCRPGLCRHHARPQRCPVRSLAPAVGAGGGFRRCVTENGRGVLATWGQDRVVPSNVGSGVVPGNAGWGPGDEALGRDVAAIAGVQRMLTELKALPQSRDSRHFSYV